MRKALAPYRSFVVVACLYLLLMQIGFVTLALPGSFAGKADFRSFYSAGRLVRDGHRTQLYDPQVAHAAEVQYVGYNGPILPFIHPSYEAALFALISLVPYKLSFALWFVVNLLQLALSFWFLARARTQLSPSDWLHEAWPLLPALAAVTFLPAGVNLIHGQDSILLLFIVALSYWLDRRGMPLQAGLLLGLGVFRFQLLIPIALLLVFSRRWKFLLGFAISALAMAVACIAVSGPRFLIDYPRALLAVGGGLQTGPEKIAVSVWPETMPNLRGLIYFFFASRMCSAALTLFTLVSSLALLSWAAWKRLPFELAIVVAILVSYHGGLHDSVLLLLPLLTLPPPPRLPLLVALPVWFLVLSAPTLATVFHLPHALVALAYLPFLFYFAEFHSVRGSARPVS